MSSNTNKDSNKINITQIRKRFPDSNFDWTQHSQVVKITSLLPKNTWYFVGGVVRDSLLGITTYDIDITTIETPDKIEAYFKNLFTVSLVGKRFGTIGIYAHPYKIEITTTRNDQNCDGRWANVVYKKSFYQDSLRRDFTINTLFYDGVNIIDYHNGLSDLLNQKIKFVGSADSRIQEDYLRIMRYIRFCARFSKKENYLDYIDVIPKHLHGLHKLSYERIGSELYNMMKYPSFAIAIELCNKYGVSKNIFGYDFPTIPQQFHSPEEKIAYLIKDFNKSARLGLPKTVQQIVYLLTKYDDPACRLWEIWRRYKRVDLLELFCKLHIIKHKPFPQELKICIDYKDIPYNQRSKLTKVIYIKLLKQFMV